MFTQEEYLWAWFFYLLGAGLFMAFWWFLTNKIKWREPKYLLRIVVAVFLLVPWYSDETSTFLSPAWIVSIIEGAFEGPQAFWRAGTPLLIAILIAMILSSVVYIVLWYRERRQDAV